MTAVMEGRVLASFGRHHLVGVLGNSNSFQTSSGLNRFLCVRRAKCSDLACGDTVDFEPLSSTQGVILSLHPRRNLLYRADTRREKLLAANLDRLLYVVAPQPTPSWPLLTRALVAAHAAGLPAHLILNKTDLPQSSECRLALQYLVELGYPLWETQARQGEVGALLPHLTQGFSLLVGQSGMGKSTLINALVPQAQITTAEWSVALDSGRHTTTHTGTYFLREPEELWPGGLIDSPGVQNFGLSYLTSAQIEAAFVEFSPLWGQCRFADCRHRQEPDCALRRWVAADPHRLQRLEWMLQLQSQSAAPRRS